MCKAIRFVRTSIRAASTDPCAFSFERNVRIHAYVTIETIELRNRVRIANNRHSPCVLTFINNTTLRDALCCEGISSYPFPVIGDEITRSTPLPFRLSRKTLSVNSPTCNCEFFPSLLLSPIGSRGFNPTLLHP